MMEQTDASKQSDERHVKNRRNTNFLTQKKTGGNSIMGNQGTKNWKLTILFAVSLMLIAGLFSNTAMAHDVTGTHPNDEAEPPADIHKPGTVSVKLGALDSDGDFVEKKKDKHFFKGGDDAQEGQALQFTFSVAAQDVSDYSVLIGVPSVGMMAMRYLQTA